MQKTFKILPPSMPNFIQVARTAKPRQEGFSLYDSTISIAELTKEEAEEYAELMRQTFIIHWQEKVNAAANPKSQNE